MFIETVPNRNSPPAVLLRESYRDERGQAQKRTLANLSKLPGDVVDALRAVLKGGTMIGTGPGELEVEPSLPHAAWTCRGGAGDGAADCARPSDLEHGEARRHPGGWSSRGRPACAGSTTAPPPYRNAPGR